MGQEEAGAELVERAKHDCEAFAELYRIYLPRVYAFCRAHSTSRDQAEDLTAQTFERALKSVARYESRGVPFSSWLFRIAANLAVDRSRRGSREVLLGDDPMPEGGAERRGENLPAALVESWEDAGRILGQVATLPRDQQQAIQHRYWEDQTVAEVARRLGRSEGATKQLLRRALRALRTQMEQEGTANV